MEFRKTPTKLEIVELLRQGQLLQLPPLTLAVETVHPLGNGRIDAFVRLDWGKPAVSVRC